MTVSTKEKIRCIAEELFAKKGYHNTTLRAITSTAKVNLAAVNYHFGSKESLLEAIFDHHLLPLNQQRLARLDKIAGQLEQGKGRLDLEEVLRAFVEPTMAFKAAKSSAFFMVLVNQALHDPDETLRHIFFSRVGPVVQRFFVLLCQACPGRDQVVMTRILSYILGAMSNPLSSRHQDAFPHLASGDVGLDEVEILITFIMNGIASS